jgi:hypothetical protein
MPPRDTIRIFIICIYIYKLNLCRYAASHRLFFPRKTRELHFGESPPPRVNYNRKKELHFVFVEPPPQPRVNYEYSVIYTNRIIFQAKMSTISTSDADALREATLATIAEKEKEGESAMDEGSNLPSVRKFVFPPPPPREIK